MIRQLNPAVAIVLLATVCLIVTTALLTGHDGVLAATGLTLLGLLAGVSITRGGRKDA